MLAEHGHHVSENTALKCRMGLGWTRSGSAYCQMIHEVNKGKRLEWARRNKGDDFSNAIYSDETTVQMETHRRFSCTTSGLKPRYKPRPKHPTKVHVWAAISKKGRSGICIFEGCMDAVAYVGILEQALLPMRSSIQMGTDSFKIMTRNIHLPGLNSFSSIMESTGGVPHLSHQIVTQSRMCGTNLKST